MWTGENDAKMLRVDKNFIGKRRKRVAFSNEYGYVWTGPQGKRGKLKPGTGRQNKIDCTIQSLPTKIDLQKDCVENPRRNRGSQRQFSENICSEDDSRSRIFGTFVVKFLACLLLLGFSNI